MKLHLESNTVEGTPEELVTYKELLKERGLTKDLFSFGHMHEIPKHEDADNSKTDTFVGALGSMTIEDSSIGTRTAPTYEDAVEAEEDAPMGYTFWYIDGVSLNHLNVLEASPEGYFEDSTGKRYTYQAVSGLVKPIDREDVRKKFEKAENYECLLKYYPTADIFAWK